MEKLRSSFSKKDGDMRNVFQGACLFKIKQLMGETDGKKECNKIRSPTSLKRSNESIDQLADIDRDRHSSIRHPSQMYEEPSKVYIDRPFCLTGPRLAAQSVDSM